LEFVSTLEGFHLALSFKIAIVALVFLAWICVDGMGNQIEDFSVELGALHLTTI